MDAASRSTCTAPASVDEPQPRGKRWLHALAGRHDEVAAVHVGEQPALGDRLAVGEGGREVEPAEQAFVGGVEGQLAERNVVGQDASEKLNPLIANGAIHRAHGDAAKPDRIDGEQRRRHHGFVPERALGSRRRFRLAVLHHPNVFCKASSTRTVEPASSRGSRRRRCRSDDGATALRWPTLTASTPS